MGNLNLIVLLRSVWQWINIRIKEGPTVLQWEEHEFIHCLESDSFFEEDTMIYYFNVKGCDVDLDVAVSPYESFVSLHLRSKKTADLITSHCFLVTDGTSYRKKEETMVLKGCIPIDDEFYRSHFAVDDLPRGYRFDVTFGIKPEIFIHQVLCSF